MLLVPVPRAVPEKHELLAKTPPFDALPPPLLRRAAQAARWLQLGRHDSRPLSDATPLYLVRGHLLVLRRGEKRVLILDFHAPGELVGLHTIWPQHDEIHLQARAELLGLHVPRNEVLHISERYPPFAMEIGRWMAERLASLRERLHWSHERTVTARIAALLCSLARRHGRRDATGHWEVPFRMTHQEIAGWVGATRETTTVVLGRLRREGLIQWQSKGILVLDLDALEACQ